MKQERIVLALTESFGFVVEPDADHPSRALWERVADAVDALPRRLNANEDVTQTLRVIVHACGGMDGGAEVVGCAGALAALLGVALFPRVAA